MVLINEGTGSAADGFAAFMKRNTKAVLIGRATAGAPVSAHPVHVSQWLATISPYRPLPVT